MLTQSSAFNSTSMVGQVQNQSQKPTEPTQIQAAVQVMEEEAKRLRAVTEHLVNRLHDVLTPSMPDGGAQGEVGKISTCPLFDMLGAQIGHIGVSRAILEDLLRRIQL